MSISGQIIGVAFSRVAGARRGHGFLHSLGVVLLVLLFCVCGWRSEGAHPFSFEIWRTQQGLPGNQVTCLLQTRDGYLWVGTENGLARFDGVRFVNFGLNDGLKSNRIWTLLEDREGTLWVGTLAGGLSRFRNGHFETIGPEQGLAAGSIIEMAEDVEGRIWIGSSQGLACWVDGRFVSVAIPEKLIGKPVMSLICDNNGMLWATFLGEGLWRMQDGVFECVSDSSLSPDMRVGCHKLWEDREGRIWVCAGENMLYCLETNIWREFSIPRVSSLAYLKSVAEEKDGTVWAGSIHNGIYFVRSNSLVQVTTADGLPENAVNALLVDREDNLWVGTAGGGLARMTRHKVSAFGRNQGLGYPVVRGLAEVAPGELWVGTLGDGLFRWRDGRFSRVELDDEFRGFVYVNAIKVAKDGSIWIATGLGLHHIVNGRRESPQEWRAAFSKITVAALCEDREGGMWVGAGRWLWHVVAGRLELQTNAVFNRTILCIAQDSHGAVWVGTEGDGLHRFQSGQHQRFSRLDGLGSDQVRALHFDADGTLWIGTASGGLTRMNNGRFTSVSVREGLPGDTISQIMEDDAGNLWVGSDRGIARIQKAEFERVVNGQYSMMHPRLFGLSDGMLSEECTAGFSPAGVKLRSGELCFATLKGIVFVNPNQPLPRSLPPTVWLEEILVDGIAQKPAPASGQSGNGGNLSTNGSLQALTVAPGDHRFEFHYTGLNFAAPERVRFRYQLEGMDTHWIEAGTRRTAYYSYVPPGTYRFRVIACNNDGGWVETAPTLVLEVQPFLWQRSWFTPAIVLLALVIVAFGIRSVERRRQARARERLEAQHAIERERTRIAKDIHDDLGATLSEIRLLSTFAQSSDSPPERVREDMRQIAAKALSSTQALDEIVWAVDPQSDTLEGFVNYACAFATEYLTLADIRCRLDLPSEIPHHSLRADVRHNLFLAFKESITNIVKHANANEAHVKMEISTGTFSVVVTDNGKGMIVSRDKDNIGPRVIPGHDGLKNMRSRMEDIGGSYTMQSTPGIGTTVCFKIPMQKKSS